jgi:hypothetical protein
MSPEQCLEFAQRERMQAFWPLLAVVCLMILVQRLRRGHW